MNLRRMYKSLAYGFRGMQTAFLAAAKRITNNPGANELFKAPSRGVWDVRKLAGCESGLSAKAST